MGKKKQPIYKIVAADVRSPRDGRFLEMVGLYNPLTKPHTVDLKEDRVQYWLNNGAQPTQTVKSLLRQQGITLKNELIKRGVSDDKVEQELAEWKKLKEASSKAQKKKISRKAKAKVETTGGSADAETASAVDSKEQKEADTESSAAEVKGAASDEKEAQKE